MEKADIILKIAETIESLFKDHEASDVTAALFMTLNSPGNKPYKQAFDTFYEQGPTTQLPSDPLALSDYLYAKVMQLATEVSESTATKIDGYSAVATGLSNAIRDIEQATPGFNFAKSCIRHINHGEG